MKQTKLFILATIVAMTLAIGLLACKEKEASTAVKEKKPFIVSVNLPLTGPIANSGKLFQDSVTMALDDLKTAGTNTDIRFDWNDNAGTPAKAATIAQRQAASDASMFYVGYSAETLAVQPIFAPSGKPVFSFSFLASITRDPQVFRNFISYKSEYPIFVNYIKKRQAKKIAIIFLDLPESHEEFKQLVMPELVKSGWKESDFALFPYSVMETDFRTIIAKVAKSNSDLIVINGFQSTLASIVSALRSAKLVGDGNVIGTFDLIDVPKLIGNEAVEGIALAAPRYLIAPSEKALEFRTNYETRFKRKPSYSDFTGYDFVLMTNDLVKRLPDNASAQQVTAALSQLNIEGVSGPIKFDQEGDASPAVETAVFRNGKLVPLK